MRLLLLTLLLVSLIPADAVARGRGCGSSRSFYRAPRVRSCGYNYRAPRVRYSRSSRYYASSTPRYSIFHTSAPQRRSFPQPTAPREYRGVYPQIVHSAGVDYVKPELGPRVVAAP